MIQIHLQEVNAYEDGEHDVQVADDVGVTVHWFCSHYQIKW